MSNGRRIHLVRPASMMLASGLAIGLYVACGTQTPGGNLQGPPGALGLPGPVGPMGEAGPAGPAGVDGASLVYGNGSAGARTIAVDEDWQDTPPTNLMFTDFTVNAGVTLDVPSGTVIRCSGTFTNDGTILVRFSGASGGNPAGNPSGMIQPEIALPHPGVARGGAGIPEFGDDTQFRLGGSGGSGLLSMQGRFLLHPGTFGGGGGFGTFAFGGGGGGEAFSVLARTAIVNGDTGTIQADGSAVLQGSGGGGGGIIILASMGSVTNNGTLSVKGGDGGPSNNTTGPGGGGGGGIINFLAPVISHGPGAMELVNGGAAGAAVFQSVTATFRWGGGGGGACRGNGGSGGHLDAGTPVTPEDAEAGEAGEVYECVYDPTPLL